MDDSGPECQNPDGNNGWFVCRRFPSLNGTKRTAIKTQIITIQGYSLLAPIWSGFKTVSFGNWNS